MKRTISRFVPLLMPALFCTATVLTPARAGADPQLPAKDPVASAFMLPRGVSLTPKQMQAYGQVRQRFETLLRSALDQVASAESENDQLQAVKWVKEIRGQIRMAIMQILATRPPDAPRVATHKPAPKKHAQHNQRGRKNRHHAHRGGDAKKKAPAAKPAPRPSPKKAAGPKRPAPAKKPAAWQHVKKKQPAAWQKAKK